MEPAEASVTALVPREPTTATTLFGTTEPQEVVQRATKHAHALAAVIRDRKLFTTINGRDHVRVEGWTLLGSMIGVFAVPVWTHPVPDDWRDRNMDRPDGWQARVEVRTLGGEVVGAATASCMRAEKNWRDRDEYALESMAQTRATSKALRLPLGFVVVLAGYDVTPAEEMVGTEHDTTATQPSAPNRQRAKPDPETERKRALYDEVKVLAGGTTKAVHDLYRAAYDTTGGVKGSDLTIEVLEKLRDLAIRAEDASGDDEIVEGVIVEDGYGV